MKSDWSKDSFCNTAVPHLTDAENVALVMEAEEYSSGHNVKGSICSGMAVPHPLIEVEEIGQHLLIVNVKVSPWQVCL